MPNPGTAARDALAQEAGEVLLRPEVRAVYVTDDERLVGVVTRRTLVREVVAAGRDSTDLAVGEIAERRDSRSVPTCRSRRRSGSWRSRTPSAYPCRR